MEMTLALTVEPVTGVTSGKLAIYVANELFMFSDPFVTMYELLMGVKVTLDPRGRCRTIQSLAWVSLSAVVTTPCRIMLRGVREHT
jgi:hypothetical protein